MSIMRDIKIQSEISEGTAQQESPRPYGAVRQAFPRNYRKQLEEDADFALSRDICPDVAPRKGLFRGISRTNYAV